MANYYYDYLVDCALMIGANEKSGLTLQQNDVNFSSLYKTLKYQQQILAAISSTVAIFPFSSVYPDYPPEDFTKSNKTLDLKLSKQGLKRQISKDELLTIHELVNQYNKMEISEVSITSSINRRSSKMRSRRRSIKKVSLDEINGSWGSVSIETIKSFPATYFNNNLSMSTKDQNPKITFIPLTDNMGNRSFAIILEFYRKFSVTVNNPSEKSMSLDLQVITNNDENYLEIVYIPSNVIFFSKYPYFNLFREILSELYKCIVNQDTGSIEQQLMEFSSILTRIPALKSETLNLKFSINNSTFLIKRNNLISNDVIDWDMTLLFQILSMDDIISILMAMFQEQKMVFLANDTNVITTVTETILLLFRPFQWKHFYLTTTPVHLYELVDAIFPFILGLPHSIKPKIIEYYQDIIVVDLEEGKICVPDSCKLKYVSHELSEKLKKGIQKRDWIHSTKLISCLNPMTLNEFKETFDELNHIFNRNVIIQFMTFMVDLFQEVISHIAIDNSGSEFLVANLDKFLNTSSSDNIVFFKEIYRTDNFNCFIDDKLRKMSVDGWVRLCNLRYPELLKGSKRMISLKYSTIRKDSEHKDNDVDFDCFYKNEEKEQEIILPTSKNSRSDYYQKILKVLNSLDNSVDVIKFKAELYLHLGETIQSLQEFHKVLLFEPLEVNHSKIRKLIRNLGRKEIEKLKMFPFHHSLFSIISYDERRPTVTQILEKHNIEQYNPPTVPISKNNFMDECRKADIAEYETSMNTLFNCLTIDTKPTKNRIKVVAPEIFQYFYKNWINFSIDLNDVEISLKSFDEVLIKGTETCVRVDGFGLGRIILTQFRLLFIPFGKNFCNTIINFIENNLIKVKIERKIRGFGKVTEVLEIYVKEKESKIIIWFTQDSEKWHQLISEINSVNRLVDTEKDKSLLEIATEQCLMYENMINCAKSNSFFKNNFNEMSKKLLPNSSIKTKSNKSKTNNHRKYLLVKIMPSPKLNITIDCAIEVYKHLLNNFDIWCACISQDKYFIKVLQILDKKLYMLIDVKIELPMRVLTMTQIPKVNKIVVCSMSHVVIIVDMNNYCIEKKVPLNLSKGSYPIYCMSNQDYLSYIYFGTNNGEILRWDVQEKEAEDIVKLTDDDQIISILVYDSNTYIVGCLYRFYIISSTGNILNKITVSESLNIMSKMSHFSLINNKTTIVIGLSRLPVLLEYYICDIKDIVCRRKINLLTKKEFNMSNISDHCELSPTSVGIATVLATKEDGLLKNLWVMFKDGSIDIREYQTLNLVTNFSAHIDTISKAMICNLKNSQVIVSIGRTDGKVILWNIDPL